MLANPKPFLAVPWKFFLAGCNHHMRLDLLDVAVANRVRPSPDSHVHNDVALLGSGLTTTVSLANLVQAVF